MNMFRFDDRGRLVEEIVRTDNRSFLRQLGAEAARHPQTIGERAVRRIWCGSRRTHVLLRYPYMGQQLTAELATGRRVKGETPASSGPGTQRY